MHTIGSYLLVIEMSDEIVSLSKELILENIEEIIIASECQIKNFRWIIKEGFGPLNELSSIGWKGEVYGNKLKYFNLFEINDIGMDNFKLPNFVVGGTWLCS